ncbi:hypothetical protein OKW39_002437 [Paraburkholderia sp. MM6662-R1]
MNVELNQSRVLAEVEHHLQTRHAGHEQHEAHRVDALARRLRLAATQQQIRAERREQADRHVDVEDPRPREVIGDVAAHHRAEDRRADHGHRP